MPSYKHFLNMTSAIGMLQFSQGSTPDPKSGYTLDDNARALIIALSLPENAQAYANLFMDYLLASQRTDGSWFNFLRDGHFSSQFDSEDSCGRTILACCLATRSDWDDINRKASMMIHCALPLVTRLSSPRAVSYALLGLSKIDSSVIQEKRRQEIIDRLTEYLMSLYQKQKSLNWLWFEQSFTYCNAIIPHALFSVYGVNGDKKALKIAHESMSFLNGLLFADGCLNIVGNRGWFQRGSHMPIYDQQPVDAASVALACWEGYENIGRREYRDLAHLCHQWYYGKNVNHCSLFNEVSGGCHDALTPEGVNQNQGAEAILSLLLTELMIEKQLNEKPSKAESF